MDDGQKCDQNSALELSAQVSLKPHQSRFDNIMGPLSQLLPKLNGFL